MKSIVFAPHVLEVYPTNMGESLLLVFKLFIIFAALFLLIFGIIRLVQRQKTDNKENQINGLAKNASMMDILSVYRPKLNSRAKIASILGISAKISWAVIAIGSTIGGGIIGASIDDDYWIGGALIGLAVGALVGFLVNLLFLYRAELGQNVAQIAERGSNQPHTASVADEIQKYKEMLDNGTITQQEFEDLKRNLIQK